MSFRIDIGEKEGVVIFLVVVRDQINLYFTPIATATNDLEYVLRDKFVRLVPRLGQMEHRTLPIRGADPEHVKRHHVIYEETKIAHCHVSFDCDVTPEILEEFFSQILNAQKSYSNDAKYQFLDEDLARQILLQFATFCFEFNNSSLQKDFLSERILTPEEKKRLASLAQTDEGEPSTADKQELMDCHIEIPETEQLLNSSNVVQNSLHARQLLFAPTIPPQQAATMSSVKRIKF